MLGQGRRRTAFHSNEPEISGAPLVSDWLLSLSLSAPTGNDKDKADCAIMTFKESDCDLQKLIGFYIDNVLPLSE